MRKLLLLGLLLCPMLASAAISFINATHVDTNATSVTGTEPTNTAENDLVLAFYFSSQHDDGVWTDPEDFTEIDSAVRATVGSPLIDLGISYKIRGSDAGNGYNFAYSGTQSQLVIVLVTLRGIDTTTPIDVTFVEGTHYAEAVNTHNQAAAAITTATDGAWVVLLETFGQEVTTAAPPTNYEERFEELTNTNRQVYVATREITSFGTETPGDFTHTDNGNADPRIFTLAIRPAATVPTFDSNPTLDACTATGCTFDYDADALAETMWSMFTDTAASPPTCAQIEATTGSHGDATEAATGSADSITITSSDAPEFPLYDGHFCLEEGTSNYSSVVTVSDNAISDPSGEQFIAITSIGAGSPCASFNTAVDPDIANGDYLLANDNIDPAATAVTISAACHYAYSSTAVRQSVLNTEVYDASAGSYHASDIDAWFNNNAPACGEQTVIFLFDEDQAATNVDISPSCTDADSDTITWTSTTLPTGLALSGTDSELLGGTPTVENESGDAETFTATDIAGATDTLASTIYVVNTWTMVDITANTLVEANDLILAAAPWYQEELLFVANLECDATVASSDVISSSPALSAEVNPLANINVQLSTGPKCSRRRHIQ